MKTVLFFPYALRYLRKRYDMQDISYHTWYCHQRMLLGFQAFCQNTLRKDNLQLTDMDTALLQEYKQHCVQKGNMPVTVNRKLAPLLLVVKKAVADGLVPAATNESLRHVCCQLTPRRYGAEAGKMTNRDGDTTVRYLDDSKLHSLLQYYKGLSDGPTREVLELFLFSFHACGLRVSDVITLEWSQILWEEASLSKVMVKTKTCLSLPLSDPALQILQRWRLRGSRFVFGLLPDNFNLEDDDALSRAIDNRNRTLNRRLNAVGQSLGFPFPLGMHVARHTFAVKALNSARIDVHLISRLLGHSSVMVTEKVYAKWLLPTLSKELKDRLSFLEYTIY